MTPFASGQAVPGNFELTGSAPEWIELLEPGREIVGRDGRTFINAEPDAVVKSLRALGMDLVIDFEHASELRAPKGEEAPAAGWVTEYEHRGGGSIWGKVEWTPRGRAAVVNREYRHLSPVIIYSKASGVIHSLGSVALTNRPNLRNTALNSMQGGTFPALTEQEIKIATLFGNSPEDILKFRVVEAARNAAEARLTSAELKICRMLGNRPEEIAAAKGMEAARNAALDSFTEEELKIAAMFGNNPAEVRAVMAGAVSRNREQADKSDNAETIRKMMGVSQADADRETARREKQEQATKLLTAEEIKTCEQMGIDPMDYWDERVKAAGLDPEEATFTGYKYGEDGKRL